MKPKIKLYNAVGLGIIVAYPTGVLVSNQTGGTACLQPELEGFYLPIGNDIVDKNQLQSPENDLLDYFMGEKYKSTGATYGIDQEDVDVIENILKKYRLNPISIDQNRLTESHEAWIYITIENKSNFPLLRHFEFPLKGVLTWTNSD